MAHIKKDSAANGFWLTCDEAGCGIRRWIQGGSVVAATRSRVAHERFHAAEGPFNPREIAILGGDPTP